MTTIKPPPDGCNHSTVSCLNQYEIIRKYRCDACSAVMMCACDAETGRRFLPHQLSEGQESRSGLRVPVTHGFQTDVCNTCRGFPEEPAPKAKMFGCTSKVQRYYWREIMVRKMYRFAAKPDDDPRSRDEIERLVVDEIRAEHEQSPKYCYSEESESQFMARAGISFTEIGAQYLPSPDRKIRVQGRGGAVSVERVVAEKLEDEGFSVLETESIPFHTLFGVYAWMLIQDQGDPLVRLVQFGRRDVWDETNAHEMIGCFLPEDFGKAGYGDRRRSAIDSFFASNFREDREDLLWLFDYWLEPSWSLRQYLWAHRPEDVARARKVVEVLAPDKTIRVIRYLLDSYWERYLGWPDLLAWSSETVRFVEVKSAKDKLGEEQKRWIENNRTILGFPFELVKVRKL